MDQTFLLTSENSGSPINPSTLLYILTHDSQLIDRSFETKLTDSVTAYINLKLGLLTFGQVELDPQIFNSFPFSQQMATFKPSFLEFTVNDVMKLGPKNVT